ncbi:hypothetical protein SCLCIDRAFT_1213373 [Scleroderma citrinum Foug A]|uniref:Uncharacterized protein n=1 Tax=Scleroderma citrinum Foug A TaxID=1036808 RepID=A0A0C3AH78_9AGAM|nr:hypothetical protein SCLCIDRAFT_1213373 [Scleroderma citrinum Foug A]
MTGPTSCDLPFELPADRMYPPSWRATTASGFVGMHASEIPPNYSAQPDFNDESTEVTPCIS